MRETQHGSIVLPPSLTAIKGIVEITLYSGPVEYDLNRLDKRRIVARDVTENLATDTGDLYYATKAAGGTIQSITGMRYGTGTTAPNKSTDGAAFISAGTYVTGSAKVLDDGFPGTAMKDPGTGAGARNTYQVTWAAGVATATAVAEVSLTNETSITNTRGTLGNTIARALLSSPRDKDVDLNMSAVWFVDFLGT